MNKVWIVLSTLLLATVTLAVDPIVYWRLDSVIDARTVRIRSDEGEKATITLACVGVTGNETNAINFITSRLNGKPLGLWALSSSETNWMARPMCLFIQETDPRHHGMTELVHHLPMLNEELIAKGLVEFKDLELPFDEYGLRARLYRASMNRK